ncbi:MAG: hypothetical protein SAL07_04025 [Oscillatoria sp. PMC 1051.18]|nr:hypothetical protein [Oscillatoria sp. PMC 1050.18]MEC5029058.1 hypothetical protein [Oscillatoria sp. PMC 1051.18]
MVQKVLTYMMANPRPDCPVYGLITNGDEFQFIKVLIGNNPQYDLSNVFSLLLRQRNQLYEVFSILKKVRAMMFVSNEEN